MTIKIGFETYETQGPGIFLTRLRRVLEQAGHFSTDHPDVWVQLSFKPLPDEIKARHQAGLTRVLVRMDGCYCTRIPFIRKPWPVSLGWLDHVSSRRVNNQKNRGLRQNLLAADGIIFQSEFSRTLTQRFVTPHDTLAPSSIIYNGIDLEDFSPVGEKHPTAKTGTINVLVSHSFQPYHRLHDSFKILAKLRHASSMPYHLHILGGDAGNTFAHVKQVAHQLKLVEGQDYTFHGKLPHDDLPAVYRSCQAMLNLSYWDPCPNVVIEALACGLPVIAVNSGGIPELLGMSGGVLVNENIPITWHSHQDVRKMPQAPVQSYAEAIMEQEKRWDTLAVSARATAEHRFNIQDVAEQYMLAAHHALHGSTLS